MTFIHNIDMNKPCMQKTKREESWKVYSKPPLKKGERKH